jgi:hypothetical protein
LQIRASVFSRRLVDRHRDFQSHRIGTLPVETKDVWRTEETAFTCWFSTDTGLWEKITPG